MRDKLVRLIILWEEERSSECFLEKQTNYLEKKMLAQPTHLANSGPDRTDFDSNSLNLSTKHHKFILILPRHKNRVHRILKGVLSSATAAAAALVIARG